MNLTTELPFAARNKIELSLNLRSIYKWIVFRIPTTTSFKPHLFHSCSLKMHKNFTNICDEFWSLPIQILHVEEFLSQETATMQQYKM
jgi:hypothetical protein